MLPRKKLDIGWSDLAAAIGYCVAAGGDRSVRRRLQAEWQEGANSPAIACLSVRTGFDLLLTALALPRGSEVILSAVTIRDMVRIIRQHGLVPVPVDVEMETLSVDVADVERLLTPRTRLVLVAHLFGSRMPLQSIAELCERRDLLLVEDAAQAYLGNDDRGDPRADVRMFSFGPIKTSTALGGALLSFRDGALASEVERLEATLPRQSRWEFLRRVLKYAVFKFLLLRPSFTVFVALCRLLGRNHDAVICGAVRGFAGVGFFERIRRRPCAPLLALLHRRLLRFRPQRMASRMATAEAAIAALSHVRRPGCRAALHSHWVFPIRTPEPDHLMHRLWKAGFDATRGASSLHVVEAPPERPEAVPERAEEAIHELLYLPVYPGLTAQALAKLAKEITSTAGSLPERKPPRKKPLVHASAGEGLD